MNVIDLHMHSRNSGDGQYSTQELIDMASERNMEMIAIADHNSVKAYFETFNQRGIKLLSAIELDCTFEGKDFHLLGYGIDINDSVYEEIEEKIFQQEKMASTHYLKYVQEEMGLVLDEEILKERARNGVYIAETLCEAALARAENKNNPYLKEYYPEGKRSDNPQVNFYWDYFSQSKKGYVEMKFMSMQEAITLYKKQGALVVLAHPGNNVKEEETLLEQIIALGIDGLEVYSSYHNDSQIDYYQKMADQHGLMATCGSDFHGRTKPSVQMGVCKMPSEKEEILLMKLNVLLENTHE